MDDQGSKALPDNAEQEVRLPLSGNVSQNIQPNFSFWTINLEPVGFPQPARSLMEAAASKYFGNLDHRHGKLRPAAGKAWRRAARRHQGHRRAEAGDFRRPRRRGSSRHNEGGSYRRRSASNQGLQGTHGEDRQGPGSQAASAIVSFSAAPTPPSACAAEIRGRF
jgi:hypothetical protein